MGNGTSPQVNEPDPPSRILAFGRSHSYALKTQATNSWALKVHSKICHSVDEAKPFVALYAKLRGLALVAYGTYLIVQGFSNTNTSTTRLT